MMAAVIAKELPDFFWCSNPMFIKFLSLEFDEITTLMSSTPIISLFLTRTKNVSPLIERPMETLTFFSGKNKVSSSRRSTTPTFI